MKNNHIKLFENFNNGEYSLKEMEAFIKVLYSSFVFDGKNNISFPSSRTSSIIIKDKEILLKSLATIKKLYSEEKNQSWYIWVLQSHGVHRIKPITSQRYNIKDIIALLKTHPEAITSMNIAFTSEEQKDFDKGMSESWSKD